MSFKEFNYKSLDEIIKDVKSNNMQIGFSENFEIFKKQVKVNNIVIPNSLAIHPMEGCDGEGDGSPGELTKRRYERFSRGGAGLLWFEAVAVVREGRAYARQLWINDNNLPEYQKLFENMMKNANEEYGQEFNPVCIMQLTHSGRFSKPDDTPHPIIAYHNPYLNTKMNVDKDLPVITDDELEELEEKFEHAAILAKKAGFHGVDIKCCHRYLNSELLSGFTRKGKYGETFEGRTRFLLNVIDRVKARLGEDFIVTTRLNIYDGIPYPYGWGTDREDYSKYDLKEPLKLIRILYDKGVRIINTTMGTPYYNPHVNRPYDKGGYLPEEHPLKGVDRLLSGTAEIQKNFPDMAVIGTGYSWLRQFAPYLAAGTLEKGGATIVGFGREAFAYPDFARDILLNGSMKKEKCCIACSKCTEIMRAKGTTGCVVKDAKVYAPIYKQYCMNNS